jgi:thymidylate synthase
MNYLQIIRNVLANGKPKMPTRKEDGKVVQVANGTINTFGERFRHDMAEGFPLTTLRQMPWRGIRVELEGFIRGIRSKRWFQDRGCKFWNEWGAPAEVQKLMQENPGLSELEAKAKADDLGPIYGVMWRNFEGVDQLAEIVHTLKTCPTDRRMICSAWHPGLIPEMALPPCHYCFKVDVTDGRVNLIWHQRSCDLMLGVGANIASYGLLLTLLAREAGLPPGILEGTLEDCHIYDNHIEAAKILAEREERELPNLYFMEDSSIFDWVWTTAQLNGYDPYDKVEVGSVTV